MPAATHNPVETAIAREVHDARATGRQRAVHIRVTLYAIPGSVVAVPLPPERSRLLRADPDLEVVVGAVDVLLEILVHPHDWQQLLRDAGSVLIGAPDVVHGLPVRHAA